MASKKPQVPHCKRRNRKASTIEEERTTEINGEYTASATPRGSCDQDAAEWKAAEPHMQETLNLQ